MRARIKADYRWNTARLCGGAEFVKHEWRPVPAGREAEIMRVPFVEIEPEAAAVMVLAPGMQEDVHELKRGKKRTKGGQ